MDDIMTRFVNASSSSSLLIEIIFVFIVFRLDDLARKYEEKANFYHSLRRLIIAFVPTAIFVNVLLEMHVPLHLSILAYLVIFLGWFMYHFIKDQKENVIRGWIFITITLFVVIASFMLNYFQY